MVYYNMEINKYRTTNNGSTNGQEYNLGLFIEKFKNKYNKQTTQGTTTKHFPFLNIIMCKFSIENKSLFPTEIFGVTKSTSESRSESWSTQMWRSCVHRGIEVHTRQYLRIKDSSIPTILDSGLQANTYNVGIVVP